MKNLILTSMIMVLGIMILNWEDGSMLILWRTYI
jgi:hypothetical protein